MNAIVLGSVAGVPMTAPPLGPLPDFDLSYVRERVAREHPDWNTERLDAAELDYRLYWARCKAPHEGSLSPGRDADEFWHAHILHTREYARDCQAYFGRFLHHRPFTEDDRRRARAAHCGECGGQFCDDDSDECGCD